MSNIIGTDIEYSCNSARLIGHFCTEELEYASRPGVVLVHDAFGVSDYIKNKAKQVAELGYAVLAANVWGEGKQLEDESEIDPMIGRFVEDRKTWMGRLQEAQKMLAGQREVDASRVAFVGYCFGGASALEYARTVGGVKGVVSLHGGLNLVGGDWSFASGKILILTGFEDPMADSSTLHDLQNNLTKAGMDWEVNTYGHTRHGFTRPDSDRTSKPKAIGYSAQSDKRSWAAMRRFLEEIFSV